jgi:hypothetical protein
MQAGFLGHIEMSVLPPIPPIIPYRMPSAEWSRLSVVRACDLLTGLLVGSRWPICRLRLQDP